MLTYLAGQYWRKHPMIFNEYTRTASAFMSRNRNNTLQNRNQLAIHITMTTSLHQNDRRVVSAAWLTSDRLLCQRQEYKCPAALSWLTAPVEAHPVDSPPVVKETIKRDVKGAQSCLVVLATYLITSKLKAAWKYSSLRQKNTKEILINNKTTSPSFLRASLVENEGE